MRSIAKFLLTIIIFLLSIGIVGGTICLFLNKANLLDINEYISGKPIIKHFVSEETYQDTVNSKYRDFENQIKKKDELIIQHELTIQQLQSNLDNLSRDYNELEKEIDDIKNKEQEDTDTDDIASYYNDMKEKKAGEIFNNLKSTEAANILSKLDSDKATKILENMNANKAAEVTLLLNKIKN